MSKLMESMAAEEDFEPNQDSSFSEDEHLPRGGATERPLTPGECPERLQWWRWGYLAVWGGSAPAESACGVDSEGWGRQRRLMQCLSDTGPHH